MAAYHAAMAEQKPAPIAASRARPGSVNAAVTGYLQSAMFRSSLSPSTQRTYRNVLERFRARNGDKDIATLQRRDVMKMMADRADTPHAANNLLKRLRNLMAWAVAEGMVAGDKNPTIGLKNLKVRSDGFRVWGEEQVAQYRARHTLGTRARLALEILLDTGLRRSDAIKLGRQHVRDGTITIKTQKTNAVVHPPVSSELQAAIDAMPASSAMTFLVMEHGKSFTANGFGRWFRARCAEAGIPAGYAAHGLRKLKATRMVNDRATAHMLKAWFGWKSLRQAERYTEAADARRLAAEAGKLQATSSGKP